MNQASKGKPSAECAPVQKADRDLTLAEFEQLARRAGLKLTQEQLCEMHQAFAVVEAMAAFVRKPRSQRTEPAMTFSVMPGARI